MIHGVFDAWATEGGYFYFLLRIEASLLITMTHSSPCVRNCKHVTADVTTSALCPEWRFVMCLECTASLINRLMVGRR